MEAIRFSVIVPLYNKGPYVKKALGSILSQTFRNFELIVIDDGSIDDSLSTAKSVLEGCNLRYQLIHQDNSGVSTARNNGVSVSRGEYVCFLDADDWWDPSFLERMDVLIRDYPDAGIYGTNYYYVKSGIERICVQGAETGYIDYCKVYAEGLKMPLWTGAVSLSRRIFDEMGGFRPHLKLGEDFDLWIQIVLKYRVAFLNVPLSYYYQDADPAWRGVGRLQDPSCHILWNLEYLSDEEKLNPDLKQLLDNLRTDGLLPYYMNENTREAAKNELDKVNWSRQAARIRALYKKPIWFLKIRALIFRGGSSAKQHFIKLLSRKHDSTR